MIKWDSFPALGDLTSPYTQERPFFMDMSRRDTMLRTHHGVCLALQYKFKGFELDPSRRTFQGTKATFLLLRYIIQEERELSKAHGSGLAKPLFTI